MRCIPAQIILINLLIYYFYLLHHFLAGEFLFGVCHHCVTALKLAKVDPIYTVAVLVPQPSCCFYNILSKNPNNHHTTSLSFGHIYKCI